MNYRDWSNWVQSVTKTRQDNNVIDGTNTLRKWNSIVLTDQIGYGL